MPTDRAARRQKRRREKKNHDPLIEAVKKEKFKDGERRQVKQIKPLTDAQKRYDAAIFANSITFGVGPAGTGKTWWAAARAAQELAARRIEKIIITRPAIEAGENFGFLPGELDEKYEPYMRPVRDALEEILGRGPLEYYVRMNTIEARPLAFLRGSTFKNCWVIADEMQNATPTQMKMLLTRIGENCRMLVNGDPKQTDIPGASGLTDAIEKIRGLGNIAVVNFDRNDVVRSGLCQAIIERYER